MKLRMGTRGSPLALAQSGQVAAALQKLTPGLEIEVVVIKTSGDRFSLAQPGAPQPPKGGAKGLFVKEIEEALSRGGVDFAVHSAKDLPAKLAPGLVIAAYPEREDPRDAFVGRGGMKLNDLPKGAKVATSSLRRQVQLKRARPDLEMVVMRGNVDTRLRKLEEGQCDGLLLAVAGLKRLGKASVPHELVPTDVMLPSPAQGALALETRSGDVKTAVVVELLDHKLTRQAVELERAVLAAVGGDCATPLGALARVDDQGLKLEAFFSQADGSGAKRLVRRCGGVADAAAFAAELRG